MNSSTELNFNYINRRWYKLVFFIWVSASIYSSILVFKLIDDNANVSRQLKLGKFCKGHSKVIETAFDLHFHELKNVLGFLIIVNESNFANLGDQAAQFSNSEKFEACDSSLIPNVNQMAWAKYTKSIMDSKPSFFDFFYVSVIGHEKRSLFENCSKMDILDWKTKLPRAKNSEYAVLTHFTPNSEHMKHVDLYSHPIFNDLITNAKLNSSISLSSPVPFPSTNNNMNINNNIIFTALPSHMKNCDEKISDLDKNCPSTGLLIASISIQQFMNLVFKIFPQDNENNADRIFMKFEDVTKSNNNISIFVNFNYTNNNNTQKIPNDKFKGDDVTKTCNELNNHSDIVNNNVTNDDKNNEVKGEICDDMDNKNDNSNEKNSKCSILHYFQKVFVLFNYLDIKKRHSIVYETVNFGEEMINKKYILTCWYEYDEFFMKTPFILSLLTSIISILFLKLFWHLIHRFDSLYAELVKIYKFKKSTDASNGAKTSFLATMSHEILAPMNGLLGMIHLLLKTDLNSVQSNYAQTAMASANSLLNLINQVIDFVRIESKQLDLECININIRALMDEILSTFARTANEKNIELAALVHTSIPNYILCDHVRLRQAISNLVDNAIKFTESGHVFLTVRILTDEKESINLSKNENSFSSFSLFSPSSSPRSPSASSPESQPPCTLASPFEFHTLSGKQSADDDNTWDLIKQLLIDEKYRPLSTPMLLSSSSSPSSPTTLYRDATDAYHPLLLENAFPIKKRIKLLFQVEDTGIGIPSDIKDEIFSPFVKLENRSLPQDKGSGIGLTLSQKLIMLMGGNITYASKGEIGTTFKFHTEFDYFEFPEPNLSKPNLEDRLGRIRTEISEPNTNLEAGEEKMEKREKEVLEEEKELEEKEEKGREKYREEEESKRMKSENQTEITNSRPISFKKEGNDLEKLIGIKILVVDDRIVRQQVLSSYLKRLGCVVDVCDNIFSALLAIQHNVSESIFSSSSSSSTPSSSSPYSLSKSPSPFPSPSKITTPSLSASFSMHSHTQELASSSNFNAHSTNSDSLSTNSDSQSSESAIANIHYKTKIDSIITSSPLKSKHANGNPNQEQENGFTFPEKDKKVKVNAVALKWDIVIIDSDMRSDPNQGMSFGFLLMEMKEIKNAIEKGIALPRLILLTKKMDENTLLGASRGLFSALFLKPIRSKPLAETLLQILGKNSPTFSQLAEKEGMFHATMMDKVFVLKRILIINHEPNSQKALANLLLGFGFGSVVCLDSAIEALKRLRSSHSFDFVIVAVDLPKLDGFEFTRRIRGMEDKAFSAMEESLNSLVSVSKVKLSLDFLLKKKRTPVVGFVHCREGEALAAREEDGEDETYEKSKNCGMDGLICMPLEPIRIHTLLANILSFKM